MSEMHPDTLTKTHRKAAWLGVLAMGAALTASLLLLLTA